MTILALAGGVGGAKLALGLSRTLPPDRLLIAVNTGDDFTHLGLRICPDLDTVMYTLAGIANRDTGWGIQDETWNAMAALEALGGPDWFRLGDRDIATHLERTDRLARGESLSGVTAALSARLDIRHRIVPASDQPIATIVRTPDGDLPFQEYFVGRKCAPEVLGFDFAGADTATPAPALQDAFEEDEIEAVIVCPSNPYVSIAPILAVRGIDSFLRESGIPVIIVSPIVGGRALKGPAAKMMAEHGIDPSALAVAKHYRDLASTVVIDTVDADSADTIRGLGLTPLVTNTIMRTDADKDRLAAEIISFLNGTDG